MMQHQSPRLTGNERSASKSLSLCLEMTGLPLIDQSAPCSMSESESHTRVPEIGKILAALSIDRDVEGTFMVSLTR